jgi:hypothetical protein
MRRLGGLEDGRDRLFLGGIDEAARVDDEDVGAAGRREMMSRGAEPGLESVRVRLVLGAAQRLDEERAARPSPQR